jgi:hypothetical protein
MASIEINVSELCGTTAKMVFDTIIQNLIVFLNKDFSDKETAFSIVTIECPRVEVITVEKLYYYHSTAQIYFAVYANQSN